jgi:putative transposase
MMNSEAFEKTKGCLSRQTALIMVFRLCQCTEKKWRRLDSTEHHAGVFRGIRFVDGLKKTNEE